MPGAFAGRVAVRGHQLGGVGGGADFGRGRTGVLGDEVADPAFVEAGQEAQRTPEEPLDDVVAAHAQGHEIGCHSFDHRNMSLVKTAELEQSIRRNAEFVKALLGDVIMTSFAFPFGTISIRTKRLMSRHFAACRGIRRGINAGLFDLSNLKSVELIPEILEKYSVGQFIQEAKARNGWLIITTHDVSSSPSPWGCTPQLLQSVVSALVSNGIEILPMKHALARFFFR